MEKMMSEQLLTDENMGDESLANGENHENSDNSKAIEEATKWGWAPKEKWRGDPNDWVDPEQFVEKFVPAIRANKQSHKELREELEQTKRLAKESMEILKKHQEETLAKKDSEYQEAISKLKASRNESIRNGEDDEAGKIEEQIEALNAERGKLKEKPEVKVDNQPNEALQTWVQDNKWFADDPDLREYALDYAEKLTREGKNPGGQALLELLGEKAKKMFPHKFEAASKNRPNAVEGAGKPVTTRSGKTASDLPPEHRKMMKEMVDAGYITEESYLKNYTWQ
jgi:hypothetical protein